MINILVFENKLFVLAWSAPQCLGLFQSTITALLMIVMMMISRSNGEANAKRGVHPIPELSRASREGEVTSRRDKSMLTALPLRMETRTH